MKIDLHAHSARSNGTDSPEELVGKAFAAGLDVVAITDHDTTTGWAEASEAAQRVGPTLVRGIELSTDNQGQSQHLLAYEVHPRHPALVERLEQSARSRSERMPRTLLWTIDQVSEQLDDLASDAAARVGGMLLLDKLSRRPTDREGFA